MKKIKDWLLSTLGVFGLILYYAFIAAFSFAPLPILGFPWWLDFLIICAVLWVPFADIAYFGVWVWAFIVALGFPTTVYSVIFYVCFGIRALYLLFNFILSCISAYVDKHTFG